MSHRRISRTYFLNYFELRFLAYSRDGSWTLYVMEIDVETPFGNLTLDGAVTLSCKSRPSTHPLRVLLLYTTAVRDTAKFKIYSRLFCLRVQR